MAATFRGTYALITQTARQIGQPLPATLTDVLADIDRLVESVNDYAPTSVASAVLDALAAGKDPASTPAVQRAIASQVIAGTEIRNIAAERLDDRRREVITAHFPAMLAGWRDALAGAWATVAAAREVMPRVSFLDPNMLGTVATPHATAWCQARDALVLAERVADVWALTVTATRLVGAEASDRRYRPLIMADLTAEELDALPLGKATAPADAGHPLDLAIPEEFRERIARVLGQRHDAEAADAKEMHHRATRSLRFKDPA